LSTNTKSRYKQSFAADTTGEHGERNISEYAK